MNGKKIVNIEYDIGYIKLASLEAARLGISRRRYIEYSSCVTLHNSLYENKVDINYFIELDSQWKKD